MNPADLGTKSGSSQPEVSLLPNKRSCGVAKWRQEMPETIVLSPATPDEASCDLSLQT